MENIQRLKTYLLTVHPVRKSPAQKRELRAWLMGELRRSGWRAQEETYGKFNGSVNVVAGDPDRARVFLCAHYDTAARSPVPNFVSPTNILAHALYHITAAAALAAAAFLLALAVCFPLNLPELMLPLFLVLALAALWAAAFGPANRSNANSNTSGVLALLAAAKAASYDKRVCLVFLDNNARGLLGAAAFRKKHPDRAEKALFINLDCVGDGQHLLLMPSKLSRWDGALLEDLEQSFPDTEQVHPHLLAKGLHYYPSDHRRFKRNVAVCACRRLEGLGYYIPRLGTRRDTVLEVSNVSYIAQCLAGFLPRYLEDGGETNKGS